MKASELSSSGWAAWVLTQTLIGRLIKSGVLSESEAAEIEAASLETCRNLSVTAESDDDRAIWDSAGVILQAAIQRRSG